MVLNFGGLNFRDQAAKDSTKPGVVSAKIPGCQPFKRYDFGQDSISFFEKSSYFCVSDGHGMKKPANISYQSHKYVSIFSLNSDTIEELIINNETLKLKTWQTIGLMPLIKS